MPILPIFFSCCLLLTACVTEGNRATSRPAPWPEDGAPAELLALADDLAACEAATGRLPGTLALLDGSGLATGGPYHERRYAYHPTGIGVLREGWRVIVADDRVRTVGQVWCLARPPVRLSGLPPLRVVRVPVLELREAAAAAGGG